MHEKVTLKWIKDNQVKKYQPCRQVYGICFNNLNQILIIKGPDSNKWQIPGGTPEKGESPEKTLERELIEEVDVEIKNPLPLGVQEITYPNNPNKTDGDPFYQYRFICQLDKLLPQTTDPATNIIFDRKFVPMKKIAQWVKWGELGEKMFNDAMTKHLSLKLQN